MRMLGSAFAKWIVQMRMCNRTTANIMRVRKKRNAAIISQNQEYYYMLNQACTYSFQIKLIIFI